LAKSQHPESILAFTSAIPAGTGFPDSFDAVRARAAGTELKNFLSSTLSRLDSPDSDCAAERTRDDADPVSAAPSLRRLLNVARDLLRRRALPFHRRRDGRGNLRQARFALSA
jgi:hypothetical protein